MRLIAAEFWLAQKQACLNRGQDALATPRRGDPRFCETKVFTLKLIDFRPVWYPLLGLSKPASFAPKSQSECGFCYRIPGNAMKEFVKLFR